jgi:rod shape-determining protein MreC
MRHISAEPPAFFHRGPSPLARLAFFGLISLALLFADTRYRYLENLRQVAAIALYPLERVARVPGEIFARVSDYFSSQRRLTAENEGLKQRLIEQGAAAQGFASARQENERLRALLDLKARYGAAAAAVEVLYAGRDPSRRSSSSTGAARVR